MLFIEREQQAAQRCSDQITGAGTHGHDTGKNHHIQHMETMGHDVAGIKGNAQHHDFNVQKLQQKAIHIGQRLGNLGFSVAGLSGKGFIGQIQHIGSTYIVMETLRL